MRHSIRVAGLAACALLAAGPAAAQTRVDVGGFGGLTVPTQDAGDLYKLGWHGAGTLRVKKESWPVGVQVDLGFHTMKSEDFRFDGGIDILSGVVSLVYPIELDNSPIVPVLHAGGGVFNIDAKFPRTTAPYGSKTRFGLSLGGGVEWRGRQSRLIPLADLRVYGIFGSDVREAGYLLLSAGLKYVIGGKRPR